MPSVIKKKSNVFLSMCEDAKKLGEDNDCTVKALAITTGVPYIKVHDAMKKFGRKNGKGATLWNMKLACEEIGFKMVEVPTKTFLDKYPKSSNLKNITTNHPEKFNKVWKDGNNYIFSAKGHVAAVVDGVNHDWSVGRFFRIRIVYKVIPK